MEAHAISIGYTSGKVYIIWEIPHDKINGYEIDRDGITIASSFSETPAVFEQPTLFDTDHHTNLFKKDSKNKLMFIDEKANPYQTYEYQVIAKRVDENGNIMEQIESDFMYITAQ